MRLCESCKADISNLYPNRKFCQTCSTLEPPKKCYFCGRWWRPIRGTGSNYKRKFCSRACSSRWASANVDLMTKTKQCACCGREMVQCHSNRKFCSVNCRELPQVLPCNYCGTAFRSIKDAPGKPRTRFCSWSCRLKGRKMPGRRKGSVVPTEQELILWKQFPESRWNYHMRTGLRQKDGKAQWIKLDVAFLGHKLAVEVGGGVHR